MATRKGTPSNWRLGADCCRRSTSSMLAQGALLQFWPEFDTVSSLVESPPGSDVLHVIDEYRFPLANHASTTPKWVLFTPGSFAPHEARDLWWAAYEHVGEIIRRPFGITPTVVVPEVGLKYRTRVAEGKLRMTISGKEVESREVPYAIAERVLPRLASQGVRRFFPEVMSQSDVTADGLKRKLDFGVHGDLHCASVCACAGSCRRTSGEEWLDGNAWRITGANWALKWGVVRTPFLTQS